MLVTSTLALCAAPGSALDHAPSSGLAAVTVASSTASQQVGAPPTLDPALAAARTITRLVRGFPSLRSQIPLASWREDDNARWQVRPSQRCLARANALHVPTRPLTRELTTPVPAPVVVTGPVGGVSFRPIQRDRELELSCEMAARLPALAKILRAHGVRAVHVNSSYRDQPRVSFHTFGLALDMASFETSQGPLVVATDFELTPEVETCDGKPSSERGRALLSLACELARSGLFSSVLTPNYNAGHRDHFHLDVRPNDSRLFVR
jgi:hypothetical protein